MAGSDAHAGSPRWLSGSHYWWPHRHPSASGARRGVDGVPARVVLIDGHELVDLMIEHGVGVESVRVATLHRINDDFFDAL